MNTEKSRLDLGKRMPSPRQLLSLNDKTSFPSSFYTNSEVLVPAAPVTDKAALLEKVNALKTKGSTNQRV
ncbi:MAG: hypothetical protein R3B54_00150 [Bdellovibrionota bacterium]